MGEAAHAQAKHAVAEQIADACLAAAKSFSVEVKIKNADAFVTGSQSLSTPTFVVNEAPVRVGWAADDGQVFAFCSIAFGSIPRGPRRARAASVESVANA